MGRENDGSEIELRTCPGCGYKRHPVQFLDPIGGSELLCSVCREMGAQRTAGRGQGAAGREQGETMGQTAACPECGKVVKARGLSVHRARAHGVRGAFHGGEPPSVPAVRTAAAPARGTVEILTDGVTLPDVVGRIRQRIAECETALRVIAELAQRA